MARDGAGTASGARRLTGATADVTLERADLALYEAKRGGRDCVRAFAPQARAAATS
jgi:PleD family two-component response regulator